MKALILTIIILSAGYASAHHHRPQVKNAKKPPAVLRVQNLMKSPLPGGKYDRPR